MSVDYDNFAKTFSDSRRSMKWEEIDYFISFLKYDKKLKILDVWCWNWRLLWVILKNEFELDNYIWVDLSLWLLKEAKKYYPKNEFINLDMLDLDKIKDKFSAIFFIASFHHLKSLKDREEVLKKVYSLLEKDWKLFMTNWALNSPLNFEKYKYSMIKNTKNSFWSIDYNVKIWKYTRYYHSFNLKELDYLFKKSKFKIIENKLFKNQKNYISILKKY